MAFAPMTVGRATSTGISLSLSLWRGALLYFVTGALGVGAELVAPFLLLAAALRSGEASLAVLVGLGVFWLCTQLVRTLVAGGVLRQGGAWLREQGVSPLGESVLSATPRALSYVLWTIPIDLLVSAWRWLALIATGWSFARALFSQEGGVLASGSLALFLTVSMPLTLLLSVWKRLGLVRAVDEDQGVLASLFDAAGVLARRLWPYLGVFVLLGLIGVAAELTISGMTNAVVSPNPGEIPPLSLALAGQAAAAILVAFVIALVELATLLGFLALDLGDRGQLPSKVPPPATLIPDAQLLPEPPGSVIH